MMKVDLFNEQLGADTSALVTTLLNEFSAVTNYRTLRDTLPRRLAVLLRCRCVILYLRMDKTLQFASGTFDDAPGWSTSLLTVAHINPIELHSNLPEAVAWNTHRAVFTPVGASKPSLVAVPLMYRQHAIGVLVAYRNRHAEGLEQVAHWSENDAPALEAMASIVALLLENTRLLERDRERIHELSLLNSIASQLNYSMFEFERVQHIAIQRSKEITHADFCELLQPTKKPQTASWVSPELHTLLFSRFRDLQEQQSTPLLIERAGDTASNTYLNQLPTNVKTFFAVPLYFSESSVHKHEDGKTTRTGLANKNKRNGNGTTHIPGIIVGAYYQARKMQREELVLLQVLASQTSTTLENMHLMDEVVEARNHARKLLQQVLNDQRLKEHMEEERRRLDRLASLGEMSANVAHEVRNPLASIKTSMQILKEELTDNENDIEEAQESVDIVLKEVERLDAIVRDLLLFARPRQLCAVPCQLTELSDHVLHMMHGQCIAANVTVKRIYHDIPVIHIDESQIKQVFFNLYMNALQAMPDGGTLTITCQVVSTQPTQPTQPIQPTQPTHSTQSPNCDGSLQIAIGVPIGVSTAQQRWLELSVHDTGVGITPKQITSLFQPFFTTKAHGIGLGLPITRRLVEDHRGYLLVESQPSYGTTFSVRLPIAGTEHTKE